MPRVMVDEHKQDKYVIYKQVSLSTWNEYAVTLRKVIRPSGRMPKSERIDRIRLNI